MPLTQGLQLVYGVQPVNPLPVDSWSGPYTGSVDTIAAAVVAANIAIPAGIRYQSMEVRLVVGGTSYKYWYRDGTTNSDLVAFSANAENSLVIVKNGSGVTINKGQVVRVIGSTGSSYVVVDLAVAMVHELGSEVTSDVLGVANDNIAPGADGYVLTSGYLGGLNTNTGYADGDTVYLSATISGSFTNIRPHPPIDLVKIGYVTTVNSSTGEIYVDLRQPVTLDEISNFSSSKHPHDNSFFVYDAAEGVWVDKSDGLVLSGSLSASRADIGSLLAGTAVIEDQLTTLNATVNNNLDVLNDVTIGRNLLVEGQILASGSAAPFRVVSKLDNSTVFYITGSRVGINESQPAFNLEVNGSFAATTKAFVIQHQDQPGKRLVHATLEGPEHAVFVRGRNNTLVIEFPEYWSWLVDEASITVHLTPIGSPDVYYVEKIENNKAYIGVDRKTSLFKKIFSQPKVDFYYMINAERKDVDKLQTVI